MKYDAYKNLVENYLSSIFPDEPGLYESMRYSLLSDGKRIRPVLTLAFCELCGGTAEQALPFGCAIELIHTYSLIHDDLPCMDNDDLRRGKPTNHKKYGEAMALLAGDGLLTYAIKLIVSADIEPERRVNAADCIQKAAFDMVRGQVMDIGEGYDPVTVRELKTGALFIAAAKAGCVAAGANGQMLSAAEKYARALGLAFQYRDDMLDNEGDCRSKVEKLTAEAKNALSGIAGNEFLLELADKLRDRNN